MSDLRSRVAQARGAIDATTAATTEPTAVVIGYSPEDMERQGFTVAADVADSGIDAGPDARVHVAWSRVMGEVQYVGKVDRRNDAGGRYDFRGIDAVLNVVGPALRKHGVAVVQSAVSVEYDRVTTGGGKTMQRCVATVTYQVFGPQGDSFTMQSVGEAFDAGDKSTPKACSVALRTLYINSLAIPTNQPQMDPEHGTQYELATPAPPTPAEYATEIMHPRTALPRLQQIRRELHAHPGLAEAVVTNEAGEAEPLSALLVRFGKAAATAVGE